MAHGGLRGPSRRLERGCAPGGKFEGARLAGGLRRERHRHEFAGFETSAASWKASAADVDEGRPNGTKPERERDDEAPRGDTRESGEGEKTETLGNDAAFIERLAARHERKTGE